MTIFDFDGDGDFDAQDAAMLGGIAGFAEESMREENNFPEDINNYEEVEIDPRTIDDTDMRLFYNDSPELFNHVVNTVRKHILRGKEIAQTKKDIDAIAYEIEAMERNGV